MDDPEAGLDPYLAPIVLREVADGRTPGEFGALVLRDGRLAVDGARPTIYHEGGEFAQGEARHGQLAFRWFREEAGKVVAQGVRVTLDREGLPAILEVLEDSSGRSLFFLTEGLEAAARERHGEPLVGRRHASEPDRALRPDVLVPALFAHAPEALGPMIYDAAAGGDVVAMHCRCEAARLQTIRRTVEYELRPLDGLEPALRAALERELGPAAEFPASDWPFVSLRLPEVF
jgi:hypothetical protein